VVWRVCKQDTLNFASTVHQEEITVLHSSMGIINKHSEYVYVLI